MVANKVAQRVAFVSFPEKTVAITRIAAITVRTSFRTLATALQQATLIAKCSVTTRESRNRSTMAFNHILARFRLLERGRFSGFYEQPQEPRKMRAVCKAGCLSAPSIS